MHTYPHRHQSLESIKRMSRFLDLERLGALLGGSVTRITDHTVYVSTPQGKFVVGWCLDAPLSQPPVVVTLDQRLASIAVDDDLWPSLQGDHLSRTAVFILMAALSDLNANSEASHACA